LRPRGPELVNVSFVSEPNCDHKNKSVDLV